MTLAPYARFLPLMASQGAREAVRMPGAMLGRGGASGPKEASLYRGSNGQSWGEP